MSQTVVCEICGKPFPQVSVFPVELIRASIMKLISRDHPGISHSGFVCFEDLRRYRSMYLESVLKDELGEISTIEQEVANSLVKQEMLSKNIFEESKKNLNFGQRVADRMAEVGGSWGFILGFCTFLFLWMFLNSTGFLLKIFDPYPYILLNLVLSSIAALQAPVIMMSQRRQEQRDRKRAENDFRVNLKAELEIRQLHEKVDHVLTSQWQRLVEIQAIQVDLMNELKAGRPGE